MPSIIKKIIIAAAAVIALECISYLLYIILLVPEVSTDELIINDYKQAGAAAANSVLIYGESTAAGAHCIHTAYIMQVLDCASVAFPGIQLSIINRSHPGKSSFFHEARVRDDDELVPRAIILMTGQNELQTGNIHGLDKYYILKSYFTDFYTVRLALFAAKALLRRAYRLSDAYESGEQGIDPDARATRIAAFKENVRRIVSSAKRRHVPILLCTAPTNVRDWAPSVYGDDGRPDSARFMESVEAGRFDEARAVLTSSQGHPAMLAYLSGLLALTEGRVPEARSALLQARDLDPRPSRAVSAINDAIRDIASEETTAVILVDLEREFEARAPDGLVGSDLIADNVHPTAAGSHVIAVAIMSALGRAGVLPVAEPVGTIERQCQMERFLKNSGLDGPANPRRLECLLNNAAAAMSSDFANHLVSRRHIEHALNEFPEAWEPWVARAVIDLYEGKPERAGEHLCRAIALRREVPPLRNTPVAAQLRHALETTCRFVGPDGCLRSLLERAGCPVD